MRIIQGKPEQKLYLSKKNQVNQWIHREKF
mgnify:CR=1 FL=1